MPVDRVRVHDLRLRLPGLNRAEGLAVAEAVARQLSEALPGSARPQHLGGLTLRITSGIDWTPDGLAARIVAAILARLT